MICNRTFLMKLSWVMFQPKERNIKQVTEKYKQKSMSKYYYLAKPSLEVFYILRLRFSKRAFWQNVDSNS